MSLHAATRATAAAGRPIGGVRRTAVPFTRLLRVQLRAWRGQRAIVWLTCLALTIGVGAALIGVLTLDQRPTVALVRDTFRNVTGYTMLWLAIGVVAGAVPFRSGWAGLILSIAPRRVRWLTASYLSVLGWAAASTTLFGALSVAAVTALLAGRGHGTRAAVGVLAAMPSTALRVLVGVTVGFALGSAFRSVAAPLMAAYVGASFIPLFDRPSKGASRLIDLQTATDVVAGVQPAPHGAGPVIAALVCWTAVPAAIAVLRLRGSDLR